MTALAAVPQSSLRAGIYGRLSVAKDATAYQRDDVELPVERQFQESLARCERERWDVVRTYPDDGYSGYTGKRRPGFEQLNNDVEDGLLDVVLFWKIDRLTRNHKDFQRLWEACQAQGARIVSVTEDFDSSTPMGEFVMRLLVGMAKMSSDDTSLRVKSYIEFAKRAAEREGRPWRWGRRPFGWAPDGVTPLETGGRLTWTVKRKPPGGGQPVEEEVTFKAEADYLRKAALHLVDGGSLRSIQTHWAAQGIITTTGHPWDTGSLRKVMLAPRNEVILGPVTSALVSAVLTDPARRTQRGSARVHLLSGDLDCGGCENPLKPHVGRRVAPAYGCHSGMDSNGRRGCGRVCRSTESVDELVKGDLLYRLRCWHLESALASATSATGGQPKLLAERQALQARLDQLRREAANPHSDYDREDFAEAKREITPQLLAIDRQLGREREQIQHSRSPILNEALAHPELVEAAWDSYTVQQRHDLLKAAGFVRGRLSPGKPRARHLDPYTFERFWRKRNGDVESISGPSPGLQTQPPKTRAELAAEQQGRYICHCGCGRPIPLRPHHFNAGASVPGLIRGHNPGGWSTNPAQVGADCSLPLSRLQPAQDPKGVDMQACNIEREQGTLECLEDPATIARVVTLLLRFGWPPPWASRPDQRAADVPIAEAA